jgi:hypothetical protein
MPLTCNIDAKGKRVRFFAGIFQLLTGIALAIFWAWPTGGWWRWAVAGTLVFTGSFGLFEARAGWCVVRAMGIKTKF